MIRHGNRIFTRAFRQTTPRFFVNQRAAAHLVNNPAYVRTMTITQSQIPLAPTSLLQSTPLSFVESLEASITAQANGSSLAAQVDEEEDGEEGMCVLTTFTVLQPHDRLEAVQ